MFFGQIELELLSGEVLLNWQKTKLPDHLQLLVEQEQGKCDIWECQNQETNYQQIYPQLNHNSNDSTSEQSQ